MGAEICNLTGLYILHDLQQVLPSDSYGLYRDVGLALLENFSKCDQERISKQIVEVIRNHDFKIDIEKGMFNTDF